MIGIYKITNPAGYIYIGQSKNIHRRILGHKSLQNSGKKHRLLRQSFNEYGVLNHLFEILQECTFEELDKLEVYYIILYNSCLGEFGLNCQTGGKVGYKWNPKFISEFKDFGKMNIFTEEHRNKISTALTGKKRTKETHQKLMICFKKNEQKMRYGALLTNQKKVINTLTGEIYESIKAAGIAFSIPKTTLSQYLSGERNNKTTLRYY